MSIGLIRGAVSLEPHKDEWEVSAKNVIDTLKNIMKEDVVDAQHIGSTAIKSICAKPIVDIAVGVRSFDRMMKHNDTLQGNGIIYRRQDHPNQHLYVCGDSENNIHTHYIHAVIYGSEEWNNYINMRDYLNAHENEAAEYARLKENLAKQYSEDRIAYTNGKQIFIEKILQKAQEWRKQCLNDFEASVL